MSDTTIAVDTFGWHTVSAVTYTEVNKAIAAGASFPTTFSQSVTGTDIAGSFSAWTVTTGGSGAKIAMSLTLPGGTITSGGTTRNLTSSQVTLEVEAGFIPQPDTSVVQLSLTAGQDVTIITTTQQFQTTSGLSFIDASSYLSLLREWLAANLGQINHVFATVDLNADFASTPNGDFSWLQPSWYSYAVAEPALNPSNDNSVFAVLCLIDNTQPPQNLVQMVSNNAVPSGQKAAFLLAPSIFLKHIMFGAAPLMFSGLAAGDATANFMIDSNGTRIISTKSLTLLPLALQNGKTVTPSVAAGNFTVTINGAALQIAISDMQFNWSPGIDIHLTYSGSVSISYDAATGHLSVDLDSQSASTPNAVTQPWLNDLNIAVGVIGGIAALIGGVSGVVQVVRAPAVAAQAGVQVAAAGVNGPGVLAAAGNVAGNINGAANLAARIATFNKVAAFVVLAGTLVGAAPGTVTAILEAIATGDYNSVAKVADLTNTAVGKLVTWPSVVGQYTLQSAQLNNALIFVLG